MFLYEITHRHLKNTNQFFDTLKRKHCKIRGNCNLLLKLNFINSSTPLGKHNLHSFQKFLKYIVAT